MSETVEQRWAAESKIRSLQTLIDRANLRRAAQLSLAERLRLGADLFDDGIRWLRQIIKAEHPAWSDEQVNQELDRRKAVRRRIDAAGLMRPLVEDTPVDQVSCGLGNLLAAPIFYEVYICTLMAIDIPALPLPSLPILRRSASICGR